MHPRPPRIRRARPLADAPVDELLARSDELAKGWLLALLERAPLEEAGAIAAGPIAANGPRICAAVLSALASDHDLARLEPGGMLEPLVATAGEIGAGDAVERTLEAVESLHGVLWSALRAELRDPEPEFVYALAERLAAVTELVRAAALRFRLDGAQAGRTPLRAAPATDPPPLASDPPPPPPDPLRASDAAEQPAPAAATNPGRDDALWVAALEDEIVRSRRSGAPLSLLLAELDDSVRLTAAERGDRPAAAFGRFAQAVRTVLRRQDLLASEDAARAWVIARDTGRPGAAALADRIAAAVATLEPVQGAPLTVSVGLAVLDEDAHDAASLLEAAEEACFAAAASGTPVAIRSASASEPGES
jgi:GGDEF domain-containing protein